MSLLEKRELDVVVGRKEEREIFRCKHRVYKCEIFKKPFLVFPPLMMQTYTQYVVRDEGGKWQARQ
jgi:hypothetical protein